jgi:hypothetical protein
MKEITKYDVDSYNKELVFIGYDGYEEYYLDINEENLGGWSFMGLRPETEDKLREYARDTYPVDLGYEIPDWMEKYFDRDAWKDDMEDDWEEKHDVVATREDEDGDTLYLGAGSGQGIFSYFNKSDIETYEDYCEHFELIGLTEFQFELIKYYEDEPEVIQEFLLVDEGEDIDNIKKELTKRKKKEKFL